jgi:hypothetical protein
VKFLHKRAKMQKDWTGRVGHLFSNAINQEQSNTIVNG